MEVKIVRPTNGELWNCIITALGKLPDCDEHDSAAFAVMSLKSQMCNMRTQPDAQIAQDAGEIETLYRKLREAEAKVERLIAPLTSDELGAWIDAPTHEKALRGLVASRLLHAE